MGDGNFQSGFDHWLGDRVPDKYGGEGFFQMFGCISSAYLVSPQDIHAGIIV